MINSVSNAYNEAVFEIDKEDRFRLVVGGAPYRFDNELYKAVATDDRALTWEPMISEGFGSNLAMVRDIFHASHTRIAAIRTPCSTDFTTAAEAAARIVDLPLVWLDTDLGRLEAVLAGAIAQPAGQGSDF